jgi:hypothetical protein
MASHEMKRPTIATSEQSAAVPGRTLARTGEFEHGSLSAFVVLLLVAVFALMGLVVDGGRRWPPNRLPVTKHNRRLGRAPVPCRWMR